MAMLDSKPITPTGFFGKNPSLRIAEFRSYLMLRFGLIFGLNMQSTIIYYWIYHITNDKLSLGLVGLAEVIPAISCSFFSGHIVDHNEKRKMVMFCVFGYILVAAALFILALPVIERNMEIYDIVHFVYFFVFIGGFYGRFTRHPCFRFSD